MHLPSLASPGVVPGTIAVLAVWRFSSSKSSAADPAGHPTTAQAPEMIGNLIARAPVVHSHCAISDLSGFEVYLPRNGKRFSALLSHLIPYERTEAPA